jgi:AraC-like DNA-binding protein
MQAWHQKTLLGSDFPLNIFIAEDTEFPPHWHEAVEVVYVLEDSLKIGVNNEVHTLYARDIFLVGGGDVHYFLPEPKSVKRAIIHFEMSLFESFAAVMKDKRFSKALLKESDSHEENASFHIHQALEKQIQDILLEYETREAGYKIALKARLFDILVILLRHVPMEIYSTQDKNRQLNRLERLEQVFQHVEQNFGRNITLEEIAAVANFSAFHFTRFFKDATGMTFGQYVNNYRVTKAAVYLMQSADSITEVVFKSGFGSIKTFNRVFRQIKGCSPTQYKGTISEK